MVNRNLGVSVVVYNDAYEPFYRLYAKGKVLGYQRSHRAQQPQTSLLRIEGVTSRTDTQVQPASLQFTLACTQQM